MRRFGRWLKMPKLRKPSLPSPSFAMCLIGSSSRHLSSINRYNSYLGQSGRLSWLTARALVSCTTNAKAHRRRRLLDYGDFERLNFNTARRIIDFYRTRGLSFSSLRSMGETKPSSGAPWSHRN